MREPKARAPVDDEKNFPSLGTSPPAKRAIPTAWSSPLRERAVVSVAVEPTVKAYAQRVGEGWGEYYARLVVEFKKTTALNKWRIYVVRYKNRRVTVAARNETVAKLVCDMEDERAEQKAGEMEHAEKKRKIRADMYNDETVWDDVMHHVQGDERFIEQAIDLYCAKRVVRTSPRWLRYAECEETEELCVSKEKIIL